MKKLCFIACLLFILGSFGFARPTPPAPVEPPKNIKLIGLNCTATHYIQTVIDLDNNEIVIISYNMSFRLPAPQVKRTGLIVNPKEFNALVMADAPPYNESQNNGL